MNPKRFLAGIPRLYHRMRHQLPGLRLILALALGTGSVFALVFSGQLETRLAAYAVAEKTAERDLTRLGVTAFGAAYLAQPEASGYVTRAGLAALDKGMDPGACFQVKPGDTCVRGAFYSLRKGLESFVGILLFPLLLASVLHAMVTGGTQADGRLARVGIRFFSVLFLLWFYPVWDFFLYRMVGIPLSDFFENGKVVEDVINAMNRAEAAAGIGDPNAPFRIGGSSEPFKLGSQTSVTQELSAMAHNDLKCHIELTTSGRDNPNAGLACYGGDVNPVRRAYHAMSFRAFGDGSLDDKAKALGEMNPTAGAEIAKQWGLRSYGQAAAGENGGGFLGRVFGWIGNFLQDTLVGSLVTLERILFSVILWLAWLGVIVARTISLCGAPLAIAWGLLPGAAEQRPLKWFGDHAKIVLMPAGLSFALLVFYALQTAVFNTKLLGANFLVGLPLKLALLIAFFYMMLKGGGLMKFVAGDVTAMAADFGNQMRSQTIRLAGTAVRTSIKGGMMAFGGAAGALIGGPAGAIQGARVGGKLANVPNQQISRVQNAADQAAAAATGVRVGHAGSFNEKFEYGAEAKQPGRWGKWASGARKGLQNTMRAAKFVWENRMRTGDAEKLNPFAGGDVRAGARALFVDPYKEAKAELEKYRKQSAENRIAMVSDDEINRHKGVKERRKYRKRLAEHYNIKPEARASDHLDALAGEMALNVRVAGSSKAEVENANILGTLLVRKLVLNGEDLAVTSKIENNQTVFSLTPESVTRLSRLIEEDPEVANLLMQAAIQAFGSADAVPVVPGRNGPIVDVNALMRKSTAFAGGVVAAADVAEQVQAEIFRRELMSHFTGAQRDSVHEFAARAMDPSLTIQREGENEEAYAVRMRDMTLRALRMAKKSLEMQAAGQPVAEDMLLSAADDVAVDISDWLKDGSYAAATPATMQAIRNAFALELASLAEKRGRRAIYGGQEYGLDTDLFERTGEEVYRGMDTDPITGPTVWQQIRDRHALDMIPDSKLYELAVDEVLTKHASKLPARQQGESDRAYRQRVQAEINEIIFLTETARQDLNRDKS